MKQTMMQRIAWALSSPAAAQSTVVVTAPHADSEVLPVAYSELRAGENRAAVEKLTGETTLDARDPSRLINLGTAYARLGRTADAAAAYDAALGSPIRYVVEIGSASCRERVCQYVWISVCADPLKKK